MFASSIAIRILVCDWAWNIYLQKTFSVSKLVHLNIAEHQVVFRLSLRAFHASTSYIQQQLTKIYNTVALWPLHFVPWKFNLSDSSLVSHSIFLIPDVALLSPDELLVTYFACSPFRIFSDPVWRLTATAVHCVSPPPGSKAPFAAPHFLASLRSALTPNNVQAAGNWCWWNWSGCIQATRSISIWFYFEIQSWD